MITRQFRSRLVAAGAAFAVVVAVGCGDSPDPDAPVDPEDRSAVDTPVDRDEVPQADIPQNLDPDLTETVPGATPGPGPDDVDDGVERDLDNVVPDANTPRSTSTVPGDDRPPN